MEDEPGSSPETTAFGLTEEPLKLPRVVVAEALVCDAANSDLEFVIRDDGFFSRVVEEVGDLDATDDDFGMDVLELCLKFKVARDGSAADFSDLSVLGCEVSDDDLPREMVEAGSGCELLDEELVRDRVEDVVGCRLSDSRAVACVPELWISR